MDGEITIRYDIVERETVDYEYIEENGEPEVEGISWEIDIPYILENPKEFSSLISFIENDSFPLKKEYTEMREFTDWLDSSINQKFESDDWFDSF